MLHFVLTRELIRTRFFTFLNMCLITVFKRDDYYTVVSNIVYTLIYFKNHFFFK